MTQAAPSPSLRLGPGAIVPGLGLAALLAFAGLSRIGAAVALHDLAALPNPYWVPEHALLLYVLAPLASLGLCLFFLAPGLLLAAAFGRPGGLAVWGLQGLALALLLLVPVPALVETLTGATLRGRDFLLLVLVLALPGLLALLLRARAGRAAAIPVHPGDLALALGAPLLVLLLFSAKFWWEAFSPDGSGGLQFTRLFVATHWPFWPETAGTIAKAPGLTSVLFVFPNAWFVRALGEAEFAVRVPMLLYLMLLGPVLAALVRTGREEVRTGAVLPLLLAAALVLFAFATVYSGGYLPWFNDSPMPAVRETLAVTLFLGHVLAFAEGRRGLMVATGLLAHLTIPTGGFWLLLWPACVFLLWRPRPWDRLFRSAGTLALAGAVSVLGPPLIAALGLPFPGGEFDAAAIVDRLRYVALADWNRLAFLIVPCGILPAAFLLLRRGQDPLSRALSLAAILFFVFFYLQGYRVLLHHFMPAMLVPLVVFWRHPLLAGRHGPLLRAGAVAGLAAAFVLAWPREMRLHTFDREIGREVLASGPVFEGSPGAGPRLPGDRFPDFNPVALDIAHELLGRTFPIGWTEADAQESFFGGPLVWYYYSTFPRPEGLVPNYLIRPLAEPGEGTLLAEHLGYGLYVRDADLHARHRSTKLPVNTGAPLLATPRDVIFGRGAKWGSRVVIDLVPPARALLGLLGIALPARI